MRRPWRSRRSRAVGGDMLALYWPGGSWVHRTPPGIKLLALLGVSAVVVAVDHPLVSGGVALGCVLAIIGAARVPPAVLWRHVKPLLVVIALLALFQAAIGRPVEGLLAAARIVAVALLAITVTATTPLTAMVDWFERTLRRCRVPPARVFRLGLTVGLTLRSLDHLGVVARRVLDARRARGLGRNLRAFAVPTVVAAGRFAHGVGEALDARGIADPTLVRDDAVGRTQ